jgi:O-phospho-L-seryl-tRNASec:L-selenocysteinyl-tRNA synthase
MTPENIALASTLVSRTYIEQGAQALTRRRRRITSLLSERRLPEQGWDEASIELLLHEVALMDSNNFVDNVGVGEREARVACPLVARRHYGLAHGIGRSGDIAAEQPKAAGSTLLARLCNLLALDALKSAGLPELADATVLPLATGMALTLTLLALAKQRPGARVVVWPRCDQKTCVKAVLAAGLQLVVVPNALEGDQVRTDVAAVEAAIAAAGGADAVVCVLSTTSCFAPRGADRVVDLARLCTRLGCGHVVNNAYGVQSAALCAALTAACRRGRVDAIVQSTDKNFMVPVGGAIVAAPKRDASLVRRHSCACCRRRMFHAAVAAGPGHGRQQGLPRARVHGAAAGLADDAAAPGRERLARRAERA